MDNSVYFCGIAYTGITYEAQCIAPRGTQNGQQWVLFLGGRNLFFIRNFYVALFLIFLKLELRICFLNGFLFTGFLNCLGRSGVGSGCVGHLCVAISQTSVELCQVRNDFFSIESLPEFEVGTTLQQFTHTLWLTNTRHFHHDATLLSLQFLDVRLNNTKLVDTRAHNVERVVNGRLGFFAQCFLYLGVGALWVHLTLQLLRGKDFSQSVAWCILLVRFNKERDKIFLAGFFLCSCLFHRFHEGGICFVVSEHFYYVRHRYLQYHVHTTFQVEAQSDLSFQTSLVRIDAQILHRVFVLLLCNRIFQLCCLAIVIASGY